MVYNSFKELEEARAQALIARKAKGFVTHEAKCPNCGHTRSQTAQSLPNALQFMPFPVRARLHQCRKCAKYFWSYEAMDAPVHGALLQTLLVSPYVLVKEYNAGHLPSAIEELTSVLKPDFVLPQNQPPVGDTDETDPIEPTT